MIISMIAAMADNRIIGKDNQMPWHLPADFAWFKRCTLGKPVIMGRKTYESIGRPLPGRHNIVISRDASLAIEGVSIVSSIEEAIEVAGHVDEVMIIGGGSIYQACMAQANKLYLTFIELNIEGDTQFPEWGSEWQEVHREMYQADDKNAHNMQFVVFDKQ
ncbi:type 3 dihydrofolate reductase [Vibrio anguillarum]|uniref:type 3 dihydrofolate reductase n=1 Tax=Vibrio anguillarum TaxID=55601 RepID=UPI00097E2D5F|nr:type 3 dihydrofolate reductase [Vibrio anguillarum]ASF98953.1 diacylglycerol kinase [Vibrio anguillarum]ASG02648.1 diacylglycerol kinase [Vibrio anguillarum]MBT2949303.1 type 3 dihydrofolate reductase [Vibrio anguillarum]